MKPIYFTPGPSQLYPTIPAYVRKAFELSVPSMNHRGKDFKNLYEKVSASLKEFLSIPSDYHIFFLASANEAWERIIENCVEKKSFHFVNGAFSNRFYKIAQELKKKPEKVEMPWGEDFDWKKIATDPSVELIAFTQNETSSGTRIDENIIHSYKKKYPKKLIAVDVVSSAPCFNLDFKYLDCVFFSVQKGFGLPPGLCILVVSPAAMEKSKYLVDKGISIGSYHNFQNLLTFAQKFQTPETPNTLAIYLLDKVIDDMKKYGLEKIKEETSQKAKLLYDFFDKHKSYKPFVTNEKIRSETVAVIKTPDGSESLIKSLKEKGFIIGAGYGDRKMEQVRIANFPSLRIADVKKLIKEISQFLILNS